MVLRSTSLNLFATIIAAIVVSGSASAEIIKTGGTGAALGTLKQLGTAFEKLHPEHTVVAVPSLGSSGGIKAVQAGAIQLSVSGRDLKPEEVRTGLSAVRYGTTPFAFATHHDAPLIQLTPASLVDVYSGKQDAWPSGRPIRLVLRPKTEGDTALLQNISPAMDVAVKTALERKGMAVAVTDTDSADQIEKFPNSLGTTTLALVLSEQRQVNLLAVNNVMPSVAAISNGTYPYTKDMYAVVANISTPGTRQFLEFILSAKGREILSRLGHRTYFPK